MLPSNFFQQPMTSNWAGSWLLAEKLVKNGFNPEIRQFRRTQALAMIASMLHSSALQVDLPHAYPLQIELV